MKKSLLALCAWFCACGCSTVSKDTINQTGPDYSARRIRLSATFSEETACASWNDCDVVGLSAGLGMDLVTRRMNGIQLAGLVAAADYLYGVQVAPLATITKNGNGVQISLGGCLALESFSGVQLAPFWNTASGGGIQVSILGNATDDAWNIRSSEKKGPKHIGEEFSFHCYQTMLAIWRAWSLLSFTTMQFGAKVFSWVLLTVLTSFMDYSLVFSTLPSMGLASKSD